MHSSARASGAAASRAKKLARARGDPGRLARGLGGRFYPDEKTVTERLQQIAAARKAGPYLRYTVSTTPAATGGAGATEGTSRAGGSGGGGPGKPALTWWSGQDAIDAEAATDGWYALLTNLGPQIAATEVLLHYKRQEAVESRYGNLKGPIAVAPMFLHSNRRIAALITVISLALQVFRLIEREARRWSSVSSSGKHAAASLPETKVDGLYNRQPARLILTTLASLRLTPATATTPAQVTRPSPVQARLPELLGVDPTRPP